MPEAAPPPRPRVLVVEDEPIINQAVADRLAAEGFDVAQEYAGPAAVATAATWAPDALPSRARIAHQFERADQPLDEVERYYSQAYAEGLYRELT